MIARREHALHHQSEPHGVKQPVMLGYPEAPVHVKRAVVVLLPHVDDENKQQTQQNVAQIREDVIEIRQKVKRMGAQKIVVAQILIASDVQHLLVRHDQLDHGGRVKNRYGDEIVHVEPGLLPQYPRLLPREIAHAQHELRPDDLLVEVGVLQEIDVVLVERRVLVYGYVGADPDLLEARALGQLGRADVALHAVELVLDRLFPEDAGVTDFEDEGADDVDEAEADDRGEGRERGDDVVVAADAVVDGKSDGFIAIGDVVGGAGAVEIVGVHDQDYEEAVWVGLFLELKSRWMSEWMRCDSIGWADGR